jgi:hypothetical protein
MAFTIGGSETMRIDSAGNVGIGTSAPSYPVDAQRSANDSLTRINLRNSNAGTSAITIVGLGNDTNGSAAGLRLGSSTNTSIGGDVLDIYQGLVAPITFRTSGTERMRITSAGNVGIGTSSPDANAKLDVNGAGRISGIGIKSFALTGGAATYTKTLTITGLGDGTAIINIGLVVSASATSLAAAYLFGGLASVTNDQKTVAVLNATTSGSCSISGITKVIGGFSVAITLTGGSGSTLIVNVMGTSAQNAAATFA